MAMSSGCRHKGNGEKKTSSVCFAAKTRVEKAGEEEGLPESPSLAKNFFESDQTQNRPDSQPRDRNYSPNRRHGRTSRAQSSPTVYPIPRIESIAPENIGTAPINKLHRPVVTSLPLMLLLSPPFPS